MTRNFRLISAAILFFLFTAQAFTQDENDEKVKKEPEITVITINSARQTAYKKNEESGNDCIILEGAVSLSVQKNDTTNDINADKIVYDRKTEMLYAEGNVEIIMKSGNSGNSTATASSLIMNTSTLEGVFDDGRIVQQQSDAVNLPAGSTLIVFSEIFGKGNENVITFKNSSLTFCDEEDPHWHIDATRTWLLPGGEFAFFNALLYVGSVPVMYFPAFYYPKDELIFNPVFNYTKRSGYSIQTTTYLWGRKPLEEASSTTSSTSTGKESTSAESLKAVYNFVRPNSLKEQVREGLILHNLDEDYTGDSSHYVKILADWYSNLGFMTGVDGVINPLPGYISKLNFNTYLGFSNTVFRGAGNQLTYYPYSSRGITYKDDSSFLGLKLPFRYAANLDFQLSKPFQFSLSLPVYSDPFFSNDFLIDRHETMDWISYLLDSTRRNADTVEETTTTTSNEVSSFQWKSSTSYSPSIPAFMRPYLSSLSFSMQNSVSISSKNTVFSYTDEDDPDKKTIYTFDENLFEKEWRTYTPRRRFYYPSLITPVSTNISASGTIFQWPIKKEYTKKSPDYVISLNKPDELKTEKQLEEERKRAEEEAKKAEGKETEVSEEKKEIAEEKPEEEKESLFEYYLPDLEYTASKDTVNDGIGYKLNYNIGLNLTTQISYTDTNLHTSDDFDWDSIRSSMYNMKLPLSLSSNFNYGGNFFTVENKVSYNPVFQDHTYMSEDKKIGYTEAEIKKIKLSDLKTESRDVTNTNAVVLRPLVYYPIFSDTNIAWNSSIRLYSRKYIGDADTADWEEHYADWTDEDSITVNSLSTDIRAKEFNNKFTQALRLEMIMPPLKKKYIASFSVGVPYATASVSSGFEEIREKDYNKMSDKDKEKYKDQKWKKSPLDQSLTVTLFDSKLRLSENFTYNMEDDNPESLKLSASLFGVQVSYIQSYVLGYDFDPLKGWYIPEERKENEEKEFLPYSFSLSYSHSGKDIRTWYNRLTFSLGLNTSIVADLLRPTNSYFLFTPSIKFSIFEFCDITFSASSRNSVLYWYFHNEAGDMYSDWGGFPGNIVKDLIDSFRFDDEEIRQNSGFKLKSLNMTISHDLHDWKANMTMKIEPRIITENGKKMYDFKPYITIGVVWNPMDAMKTSIVDDYGEWKLE
ncbi:LPS-assembly protein LptD [Treponema bryantii]|uniref:LPS-assembly protein LptD n=1 Tax=Treponema bryantii TaxID=163 RepID=UPI0003B44A95|nr:LPS-assembly protein LptD [Treponema bryantii]